MALIMFMAFNVPAVYLEFKDVLSLYASSPLLALSWTLEMACPTRTNPRWISPVPRHLAFGLAHRVPDEDPDQEGLLVHVDRSARVRA